MNHNRSVIPFLQKMRKANFIQFATQFIFKSSSSHCRSFSSPPSNNKLFVAGLSWSVDEKSLKEAFSSFGEVSEVRIMYDKDSGRSRGFGFVNFSTEDEASSAKDAMDGKAFLGRPLKVSFALDKVQGERATARCINKPGSVSSVSGSTASILGSTALQPSSATAPRAPPFYR